MKTFRAQQLDKVEELKDKNARLKRRYVSPSPLAIVLRKKGCALRPVTAFGVVSLNMLPQCARAFCLSSPAGRWQIRAAATRIPALKQGGASRWAAGHDGSTWTHRVPRQERSARAAGCGRQDGQAWAHRACGGDRSAGQTGSRWPARASGPEGLSRQAGSGRNLWPPGPDWPSWCHGRARRCRRARPPGFAGSLCAGALPLHAYLPLHASLSTALASRQLRILGLHASASARIGVGSSFEVGRRKCVTLSVTHAFVCAGTAGLARTHWPSWPAWTSGSGWRRWRTRTYWSVRPAGRSRTAWSSRPTWHAWASWAAGPDGPAWFQRHAGSRGSYGASRSPGYLWSSGCHGRTGDPRPARPGGPQRPARYCGNARCRRSSRRQRGRRSARSPRRPGSSRPEWRSWFSRLPRPGRSPWRSRRTWPGVWLLLPSLIVSCGTVAAITVDFYGHFPEQVFAQRSAKGIGAIRAVLMY